MLDFQVTVYYADTLDHTQTINAGGKRSIYLGLATGRDGAGRPTPHYYGMKPRYVKIGLLRLS
jgi:hypothetical protein